MKSDILKKILNRTFTDVPTQQVYDEYMANIIKQIPNAGSLKLLKGTSNAQASFYYKDLTTGDINTALYNNLLDQRIEGTTSEFGVDEVELAQNSFISDYNSVYLKLMFQLSTKDQATQQQNDANTAKAVRALTPLWNAWVQAMKQKEIPELDKDTKIALIQITNTLQTIWVSEDYIEVLKDDPSYPYTNLNNFDKIFGEIPASVSKQMRTYIVDIYSAQGKGGVISAMVANATQTIAGIINNVQNPDESNGGMNLTGDNAYVPGLMFAPNDPLAVVGALGQNPPTGTFQYTANITKSEKTTLNFQASVGGGINIPILSFFSLGLSGGASGSIFQEDFAGSKYSVKVVVNNPTVNPIVTINPQLYNISTRKGWMSTSPVKEAIKNGKNTDVTGYRFTSEPNFNFAEGGDFGYINSLVLSQFLELSMTFEECNSKDVKNYFEQHASAGISFLGIKLGGASESSSHSYEYSDETNTSITVTLKPNEPGYTPGTVDINESLCQLVAVGVEYPFA